MGTGTTSLCRAVYAGSNPFFVRKDDTVGELLLCLPLAQNSHISTEAMP
jgi:hypothetical protein